MGLDEEDLEGLRSLLDESRERYRELYDSSPVGLVTCGEDLLVRDANPAFLLLAGIESAAGRPLVDLVAPESRRIVEEHFSALFGTGVARPFELRFALSSPEDYARAESRLVLLEGERLARCAVSDIGPERGLRLSLEGANEELRRRNEELRQYRDRLHAAMHGGASSWWQIDVPTGKIIFNDVTTRRLGYSPEDFDNVADFAALVHPDDREAVREAMRACIAGVGDYDAEYRKVGADGRYRWFHDHGRVSERSEEGAALTLSGLVTDISDRVERDGKLRENERKFELLFEFIPMGLTLADAEGRIVSSNRAAERILGLGAEEHAKRRIDASEWRILRRDGSEMPAAEFASVRALAENDLVENVEMGVRRPDGSIAWLVTSAVPTGIPGMDLAISYLDVTRRVVDEELLRLEKRKLRLYLDGIPQPVIVTDSGGRIEDVNSALCELYGYSREEVLGRTPRMFNPGRSTYREFGYSEAEYERLFSSLWKAIANPAAGTWQGLVINRRKDGRLVWVELLIKSLFDQEGRAVEYVALPVDVSGMKDLERRGKIDLYRALAELSELRDNETGNHMKRVGIFSRHIAKALSLPARFCDDIELFAPMHDIGKVGIPDSILLAPRKLTSEEEAEMRRHTRLGHDILEGKSEMEMAAEITLGHHEKWDGTGYPSGRSGETIPLAARIAALADVYDALRSRRPYKPAWTHERAASLILEQRGAHFDPSVVDVFEKLADSFRNIYDMLDDA